METNSLSLDLSGRMEPLKERVQKAHTIRSRDIRLEKDLVLLCNEYDTVHSIMTESFV